MKLRELLHNIIGVNFDAEIKGVTCSPKKVKEGYLFVSVPEKGNAAELYVIRVADTGIQEKKRWIPVSSTGMTKTSSTGMTETSNTGTTEASGLDVIPARDAGIYIFHPNPQKLYSEIVSRFYQFKHPKYTAAVTGTNGKTSVVEFCRQIWQNAGYTGASIGTLGTCISETGKIFPTSYRDSFTVSQIDPANKQRDDDLINQEILHSVSYINNNRKDNNNHLTTPDAEDLYSTLRDINSRNIEHLALEASSHGIDQYRIHGLKLSAAAFTNFSQDHLDYHKNVGEYLEAKKRLFSEVLPEGGTAILNADIDEYSELLKIAKKRGNKIITYGKKGSDVTLLKQMPTTDGQHLTIKIDDEIYNAFFPVLGEFQAYNLLCAIGIVISSGVNYGEICIEKLVSPPGRMEKVSTFAFVDYAHTPSALKQSLLLLKWHFNKKIVLVFGCGGNRDQTKRSEMGKIAQMYADMVIITDDNPRDEDSVKIRYDILSHCTDALEIGDRREAIEQGIDIACNENMILLVAGKGHEKFQIIGSKTFAFSDVEVIRSKVIP